MINISFFDKIKTIQTPKTNYIPKDASKNIKVNSKLDINKTQVNFKLIVPEKWKHLDYTAYGNPQEVSKNPKEYLSGDKLYEPDDPRYYHDGQVYFGREAEEKLMSFFNDRERLKKLIVNEEKSQKLFDGIFSDINNFIYIDEKTGRKELLMGNSESKFEKVLGEVLGCAPIMENSMYQCNAWKELAENYMRVHPEENKNKIYKLYEQKSIYFDNDFKMNFVLYTYGNKNKKRKKK